MSDRTVLVRLKADTRAFETSMRSAATTTTKLDKEQGKVAATTKLKADTRSYTTGIKSAETATDKMADAQADAQARTSRWSGAGAAMTIAGGVIAAGLAKATQAASNQEQALGGLKAVFKENAGQMEENARKAADLGLSTTDYADSATRLGAQLGNLGVDQSDLAGTTDGLISKANDMAAQFGGPTSDAVEALGAMMRGENDPIEKYGISINDAGVKAEQAATGVDATRAKMQLLQKQLEKSGTIGAAGREFDSMASSTQRARAQFDNATASLGEALLPALSKVANAASSVLEWFNKLPSPVKDVTTYLIAFSGAALLIGPRVADGVSALKSLKDWLSATGDAADGASSQVGTFAGKVGKGGALVVALGAAELAVQGFSHQVSETTGVSERWTTALGNVLGSGVDPMRLPVSILSEAVKQLGINMDILPDNIFGGSGDNINQELQGYIDRVNRGEGQTVTFNNAIKDGKAPAEAFADAQRAVGTSAAKAAGGMIDTTDAMKEQADTLRALKASLSDVISLNRALIGDEDALIGQEKRLAKARRDNGRSLDGNTKGSIANREAMGLEVDKIAALAKSTYDRIAATGDEERAQRAANRVISEHVRELQKSAIAAEYSKAEVKAYIERLGMIPGSKSVSFSTPGLNDAKNDADNLNAKLVAINGTYTARMVGDLVGDPIGNARDVKNAAGSIVGDYVARLFATPIGNPVGTAQDVGRAAGSVVGDYVASLFADKKHQPIENAQEVGRAAGSVVGDYVASLFADKKNKPIENAQDVGKAAGSVVGNYVANLFADKKNKPVEAAEDVGRAAGKAAGNYVATISVNAGNSASQAYAIGAAIGKAIGDGINAGKPPKKKKKAAGGVITGPGTGTSDTAGMFALSNGEYVVREKAVRQIGKANMDQINQGKLPTTRGYATGGAVGAPRPGPTGNTGITTTSVPVIVQLDSRAIATGQLRLQRQSGGTLTVGG